VTNQVKLKTVMEAIPNINPKALLSVSDNAPLQVAQVNAGSETYGCFVYMPKE